MTQADIRARRARLLEFIKEHREKLRRHPTGKWVLSRAHNLLYWYAPQRPAWKPSIDDPLGHGGRWAKSVDELLAEHWPDEFERNT